jgi:integrase
MYCSSDALVTRPRKGPAVVRREFGQVRQLRSDRWQARWKLAGVWHTARRESDGGPMTFTTAKKAADHLAWVRREIEAGRWRPPTKSLAVPTLREYANGWLMSRDLGPTTRDHYWQVLRDHIFPTFGDVAITAVTPAAVRTWHADLARPKGSRVKDRPTARAHAYGLLRTIMNTAVADEVIAANPCRVRGGGQSKRVKRIVPATLAELEALTAAMPERYELMILLASWCGLRFGEIAELRRSDVDPTNGVIHIRRGVVRTSDGRQVKGPKSDAGRRDVAIPPHLLPAVRDHLTAHAAIGRDGLLFAARHGGHMAPSTLYRVFYPAREAAGRPDLRFHDLRHTGAVLAASTGATLAELMARLGHSTPGAALRYQHAAQDRDKAIAAALSELVTGNVTPINTRKRKEGTG